MYEAADAAEREQGAIDPKLPVTQWRREQQKVRQRFANALAREYLSDFSEATQLKVFEFAWERGHASGWREIENEYQDLATLVETVNREK